MRKSLVGFAALGIAAALSSAPAQAQLFGPYDWTGPYAGLNLGYGWEPGSQAQVTATDPVGLAFVPYVAAGGTPIRQVNPRGIVGGVQGGYDVQLYPWLVLGGVADFDGSGMSASDSVRASPTGVVASTTLKRSIDWFGTLRLKAGVPVNNLLFYGTGGFAFGNITDKLTFSASNGSIANNSNTKLQGGLTGGAGVEYGWNQYSFGVEYLLINFNKSSVTANLGPATFTGLTLSFSSRNVANILRATFNYRFPPPPAPPPGAPVAAPPVPPPAAAVPQRQMFIVFFEFDKSSLTPDGRKVVDAAAAAFKSGKQSVAIAGYTDLAGTQQYNLALSKRRADTVKEALARDGVPATAIGESWHGKENPRVPTANGMREPQNRRVEITM